MNIELFRELVSADHTFIVEKPHEDGRQTMFIWDGGYAEFRNGKAHSFFLDGHERKLQNLFFCLLEHIKYLGGTYRLHGFTPHGREGIEAWVYFPGLNGGPIMAEGNSEIEALVRAFVTSRKAVSNG